MKHVLGILGIPEIPDHKAFCKCCNVIVSAKTFDHHLLSGKHKKNAEIFLNNNVLFKKEFENPNYPVLSQNPTDKYLYRKIIITKLPPESNETKSICDRLKIGNEYNVVVPEFKLTNDEDGVCIAIGSGYPPFKILNEYFEFLF